jgi:hypothetical protein
MCLSGKAWQRRPDASRTNRKARQAATAAGSVGIAKPRVCALGLRALDRDRCAERQGCTENHCGNFDSNKRRACQSSRTMFPSRIHGSAHLGTRQYARILEGWVEEIGLDTAAYGTHTMRRTKATLIYRKTKNLSSECRWQLGARMRSVMFAAKGYRPGAGHKKLQQLQPQVS